MSANQIEAKGLTRVILEALLESAPEALATGEQVDHGLLEQVERQVHDCLAPGSLDRDRMIFDFVFGRAFKEAREIYLSLYESAPLRRPVTTTGAEVRAFA